MTLSLIYIGFLLTLLIVLPALLLRWLWKRLSRPRPGHYNPATGGWTYDE